MIINSIIYSLITHLMYNKNNKYMHLNILKHSALINIKVKLLWLTIKIIMPIKTIQIRVLKNQSLAKWRVMINYIFNYTIPQLNQMKVLHLLVNNLYSLRKTISFTIKKSQDPIVLVNYPHLILMHLFQSVTLYKYRISKVTVINIIHVYNS